MRNITLGSAAILLFAATCLTWAEETPSLPGPEKEHAWLKQFVGQWETHSESFATAPGQPEMKCSGSMTSRMLGDFWVVSESKADMQGTTMHSIQTIGYDPEKKKYIGTWVDSMTNHMWKYEGGVDSSSQTLTLEAEGPNFMAADKMAKYRDAYTFESKDHIVMTSSILGDDGKWVTFMKGDFRREK